MHKRHWTKIGRTMAVLFMIAILFSGCALRNGTNEERVPILASDLEKTQAEMPETLTAVGDGGEVILSRGGVSLTIEDLGKERYRITPMYTSKDGWETEIVDMQSEVGNAVMGIASDGSFFPLQVEEYWQQSGSAGGDAYDWESVVVSPLEQGDIEDWIGIVVPGNIQFQCRPVLGRSFTWMMDLEQAREDSEDLQEGYIDGHAVTLKQVDFRNDHTGFLFTAQSDEPGMLLLHFTAKGQGTFMASGSALQSRSEIVMDQNLKETPELTLQLERYTMMSVKPWIYLFEERDE